MSINASISQPQPEGMWSGKWQEQTGEQRMRVRATHARDGITFRVFYENRWGYQLGDLRTTEMRLTRDGAEVLRDALTAALDWEGQAPTDPEERAT